MLGQAATVGGPRGSFIIPLGFDWHLLADDETVLLAIARRLEKLPAGTCAIVVVVVVVQVSDTADRRTLRSAAAVTLQWVADAGALLDAVRALEMSAEDGHARCAGEAATMTELRRIPLDEKDHDRHAIRAAAYWKHGAVAHLGHLGD